MTELGEAARTIGQAQHDKHRPFVADAVEDQPGRAVRVKRVTLHSFQKIPMER